MDAVKQVRYRFDVPAVVTVEVTTGAGEDAARETAGALDTIEIQEFGQVVEYDGDAPDGTTVEAKCVTSHDRGYLVEALDADGNVVPTGEPEVCPKPITEATRESLAGTIAWFRADVEKDEGEDCLHDAFNGLASDVENCLGIAPSYVEIQPAMGPDFSMPYPFLIGADGSVGRQDLWEGDPLTLLGFQRQRNVQTMDLLREDFLTDPQQAVGMFAIFLREDGSIYAFTLPIESVKS